jgi:hypothetical protein
MSWFIGWTPGSAVVRELLEGLCRQIAHRFGATDTTPSSYRELVQELPRRLALATPEQPLILFLDALDQVSEADNARNLGWLPFELPPDVRLIVSASTDPGDVAAVLARRLPGDHRFPLDDMPVEEAHRLLSHWFDDAGRTLQGRSSDPQRSESQWKRVLEAYRACPRPLYLKLAFEEARRWRSFDAGTLAPESLAQGIAPIIGQLFDRLSNPRTGHGKKLVEAALGYLMAAKNGLTEDEMLDVLSEDPDLWGEIQRYHRPPEQRLPVALWSRLYFDLEPYLTLRRADETALFRFHHRLLEEEARKRYRTPARHHALAEYFAKRDRVVEGRKIPTIRKLSELPYQQTEARDMWAELYHTLTDLGFLEAKCRSVGVSSQGSGDRSRKVYGGVYELQEDYRRALSVWPAEAYPNPPETAA